MTLASFKWNCSWNFFVVVVPPRWRGQEWVYFRLLIIACYCYSIQCFNYPLYDSMEKHVLFFHMWLVLVITCDLSLWLYRAWTRENCTYLTFLNLQSINWARLWVSWLLNTWVHLMDRLHSLLGPPTPSTVTPSSAGRQQELPSSRCSVTFLTTKLLRLLRYILTTKLKCGTSYCFWSLRATQINITSLFFSLSLYIFNMQ